MGNSGMRVKIKKHVAISKLAVFIPGEVALTRKR
jgi:hypothetical protein